MTTGTPRPTTISVPTTKILAIGRWTTKATASARGAILPHEMRDTARLYLSGKIDQWYFKAAVAVRHDIEPGGFLLGDDAGDRVEILFAEQRIAQRRLERPAAHERHWSDALPAMI